MDWPAIELRRCSDACNAGEHTCCLVKACACICHKPEALEEFLEAAGLKDTGLVQ